VWAACATLAWTSASSAAESPAPAGDAPGSAPVQGAPSATEAPFRFHVVVDAPRALTDTLSASLGLVRWESYADMTQDLFDRLAREAIDEAHEAAATEGYFSANVDVTVDTSRTPAQVTVHVTPGEPTQIRGVDVRVAGPASEDPVAGAPAIDKVRSEWRLPVGAIFRQAAWTDAKARAVATLAAERYAAAKLTSSEADIDPDTRAANLRVDIDSGPPFRIGDLKVEGTQRYDASLVRNYSTLARGAPYLLTDLDQYMRRLNATGYFASVHAVIDTDPAHADDAPVTVSVIEAPPKRIETGIGYSTDKRFRASLNYRDVDFAQRALQFTADVQVEQLGQTGSLRLVRPPDASGWSLAGVASVERTDVSNLVTETTTLGGRRISLDERNQWQYGGAFIVDRQRPSGADTVEAHSLYFDVERAWRRMDDLAAPTRGYATLLQLGAGVPGVSSRGFGRVVARFAAWHPIDRENDLSARLEGGAVLASSRNGVPSTLLFRTGGDQTVRGYAFDSLGVREGDATVPGRYFALASLEATHWFRESIGAAVFVDAGNAADEVRDLEPALGYGVGARVRTPIGPLRLDIAYGARAHGVRIHFSVGLAF
jgi:translocation and assembly module TamA